MAPETVQLNDLLLGFEMASAPRLDPSQRRTLWDAMVEATASAPQPAEVRAMAFAARLGPADRPSRTWEWDDPRDDDVIDLAGEEAAVAYLTRLSVDL